eukprot:g73590.t1
MGEPNEIAEGVGAINLAGGGFWKTWGEVEEKAPTEMKNPRLVRCREFEARKFMTRTAVSSTEAGSIP